MIKKLIILTAASLVLTSLSIFYQVFELKPVGNMGGEMMLPRGGTNE